VTIDIGRKWIGAACAFGVLAIAVSRADAKRADRVGPPSDRAVREFFADRREPIYFDDTLSRQFALGVSGGVEEERLLPGGARFVATCRPRNCEDKAAAVIARDGRIIGAGMIGFRCRERGDGVPPCDEEPSAFVFVKGTSGVTVRGRLREWAISLLHPDGVMNDGVIDEHRLKVIVLQ
jgi:hypothetical protein